MCEQRLFAAGYKRRRAGIYTTGLSTEVDHWLGLPDMSAEGRDPGEAIRLTATVGVRHDELERAVAELAVRKPSPYSPATLSTNVGYLTPAQRWEEWEFTANNAAAQSEDLVTAAVDCATRVFGNCCTLREVLDLLMQPGPYSIDIKAAYRVPVTFAILGNLVAADAALQGYLESLGGPTSNLVPFSYRAFAARFSDRYTPTRGN